MTAAEAYRDAARAVAAAFGTTDPLQTLRADFLAKAAALEAEPIASTAPTPGASVEGADAAE